MARKSLGHVELEWECPRCGARNPGSSRTCSGCGAPQPDDVEFQNPVAAQMIEDDEKLEQATAAPDIHCPYCNARNRADATTCVQCGGDLTEGDVRAEGRVVGALHDDAAATAICSACGSENPAQATRCAQCGAPLEATPPPTDAQQEKTQPKPIQSKGGCSWFAIAAVAGVIALLGFGLFYFFTGSVESVNATVIEAQWSRTIQTEALVPVVQEAWDEEIPAGANVLACTQEVQRTVSEPVPNSREVCGTPFVVDEGTGFGEVVQECEYEVLADYCEYEVLEWRSGDDIQLAGTGHELRWPDIPVSETLREGERTETLQCRLEGDGSTYTYRTRSEELFAACVPGARWQLELNRAGGVSSATPQ